MRIIPKTDSKYAISDDGRIYSFHSKMFLKPTLEKSGYLRVCHFYYDGKRRPMRVHRLVAITYLANPENKSDVDHKNGDKSDNNVTNLRWCTESENMLNRVAHRAGRLSYASLQRGHFRNKPWLSQYKFAGKRFSAGYYATELEAHDASVAALSQLKEKDTHHC